MTMMPNNQPFNAEQNHDVNPGANAMPDPNAVTSRSVRAVSPRSLPALLAAHAGRAGRWMQRHPLPVITVFAAVALVVAATALTGGLGGSANGAPLPRPSATPGAGGDGGNGGNGGGQASPTPGATPAPAPVRPSAAVVAELQKQVDNGRLDTPVFEKVRDTGESEALVVLDDAKVMETVTRFAQEHGIQLTPDKIADLKPQIYAEIKRLLAANGGSGSLWAVVEDFESFGVIHVRFTSGEMLLAVLQRPEVAGVREVKTVSPR